MKSLNLFGKTLGCLLALAAVLAGSELATAAGIPEGVLTAEHPGIQRVAGLQNAITPELMSLEEILGTAVGQEDDGEIVLTVFVHTQGKNANAVLTALPAVINGVRVSPQLTDRFRAFAGNKAKQTPPIQLGTSGGWGYDLANGYCCGGTLGSLIQVNGVQYILSNYHVLESDIVTGGNSRVAATGDWVLQPGLIDVACNANGAQTVATLVKTSSLPGSNVDAAVARVASGMVRTDGAILGIGTISKSTVGASINQKVKKSGRTTGLTTSNVSGLNATISVTYENECAGGTAFTKTFTGQIVIKNVGSKFLNSGDSGSLMVENVSANPRAVGLLFAGSSTSAIANPIGPVLTFLGGKLGGIATMVGN